MEVNCFEKVLLISLLSPYTVTTGIDDRLRAVIGGASAVIALLLISVVVIALIILLRLKLSLLRKILIISCHDVHAMTAGSISHLYS